MIPQKQLSKLSNRLFNEQGGRRIQESILERDYCIAWFLVGLSRHPLSTKMAFKGGTALRRCYFHDYRFSEDLDFTLLEQMSFEDIKKELELVYKEIQKCSNILFKFSREDSVSHQNSYTFYLAYEGPLPNTSKTKEIKVDITIKECVYYPTEKLAVLKSCEEYLDLPEDEKITAYSILEIICEKTIALHDKARTEPRDLYDIWYILEHGTYKTVECLDGINAKLAHRGKTLAQVKEEFNNKESRLKKAWETRLSAQISNLPEFDGVYRAAKRAFRQGKIY